MAQVTLPANIKNGDPLDADQVMSNDQTITQAMNGGLESVSNVKVAAPVSQPGSANQTGVSVALAASDHQHIIQGFENRAADPTTGNFTGRVYWNTATAKFRYCTATAGSGTFTDLTPDALTLVLHAAQHKDGGHDPLADNTITDHMKANAQVFAATLAASVVSISGTGFSNICDLAVTTTGIQTLLVLVALRVHNNQANIANVGSAFGRVLDVTAGNITIPNSVSNLMNVGGNGSVSETMEMNWSFLYQVPAGGARTLRVQAGASAAGNIDIWRQATVNGETTIPVTVQAAVL